MLPTLKYLQYLLVPCQEVEGLRTLQHQYWVKEALDKSDVAFFEVAGHFLATNDVTEDSRGDLVIKRSIALLL